MTHMNAFEKILDVRTTEKDVAYKSYQEAMDYFEVKATELYHLLKEKEAVEATMSSELHQTIRGADIQSYHRYLHDLYTKIDELQYEVQQARSHMDTKQGDLTESFIEMKKIEKIIEGKKATIHRLQELKEQKALEEASIQQFLRGGKR